MNDKERLELLAREIALGGFGKAQEERNRDKHHDTRLVALSACFAAACVIIGFLLGRFVG